MKLTDLVLELNGEILEQLKRSRRIPHSGENGRAQEEIIRRFLRQLLPASFGVDTGFVIDANGKVSRQIDIVVHRIGYHPVIEVSSIKHFMVESVVAVIGNKACIQKGKTLNEAFKNIASVKCLDKTGDGHNEVLLGGTHRNMQQVDPEAPNAQVLGAIVAGVSMPVTSYVKHLHNFTQATSKREWPNLYLALNHKTSVYFLKHEPGQPPEGTTTPSEHQRIGYSDPSRPDPVPPLIDLAYWLVEYIRRSQIIDF